MIDTHAHVSFRQFDLDREAVIARARAAGLSGWIEVGTTVAHSQQAVSLAAQQEGVRASVGVHPSDIAGLTEKDWEAIATLVRHPHVAAVGEVGFDFYRGGTQEAQVPVLERFVRMALAHRLPVIFHVRDGAANAHDALIAFLRAMPPEKRPDGVIHTYSGTRTHAEQYLELGLYLSFSGVVTFKNAGDAVEVATTMPLDRLLIETDCPFLAPEPHRGKRNEPAYVTLVAQKIAELRGLTVEEIDKKTTENAQRLFDVK